MKVKFLAQEHSRMTPARARTRTARSGVEHTNHEATLPLRAKPPFLVDRAEMHETGILKN